MDAIDPDSPVPLYHQIAEAIRRRIESGELGPGTALAPLREAARHWGVNLHTVRHAYTALAREGLVTSSGRRGTRVAESPDCGGAPKRRRRAVPDVDQLAIRMVAEAEREHGVGPSELAAAIERIAVRSGAAPVPIVWIVECSEWQCRCHAREVQARFAVDARAWPLDRAGVPPAGDAVLATYFHYNDIRRDWPARLGDVRFVTIRPDDAIVDLLPAPLGRRKRLRVLVCEHDEPTVQNVTADISAILPDDRFDLRPTVVRSASDVIDSLSTGEVALFAPRVFAALDEEQRSQVGVYEIRYVFDETELDHVAADLSWMSAARFAGKEGAPAKMEME